MAGVLGLVGSAIVVFVATNLDGLVILTVLFGSRAPSRAQIVVGQYLGFLAILAVSVIGAAGLRAVPEHWVGLLGLIPLGLGIRGLLHQHDEHRVAVSGMLGVAGITIANGADNISVYIPLFRTVGWATLGYIAVFMVLVVVWCGIASVIASHPAVTVTLDRYGHWLVPVVFIVIGLGLLAGVAL